MRRSFYQVAVALCLTGHLGHTLDIQSTADGCSSDPYTSIDELKMGGDFMQASYLSQSDATLTAQPELFDEDLFESDLL